jgi:erythritol kinase
MTSTVSLDWFIRQFCESDLKEVEKSGINIWDHLERKIENIPVGSEGVIYNPFIDSAGERAPFVKPTARAQFLGLNSRHTKYHLLRAIYEGVTMSARDCYEYMPKPINEVRLAGGGVKSAMWAQMHADITGKVVQVMAGSEFGGKGAAINAGVAIGIYSSFESAVARCIHPKARYFPDPKRHETYQEVFKLYRKACESVWDFWDERRAIFSKIGAV